MKKSPSDEKLKNKSKVIDNFDREKVLRAFARLGYMIDYEAKYVTILRNSNFPFQRVVIPAIKAIHIELLKLHANDLHIPVDQLIKLIE